MKKHLLFFLLLSLSHILKSEGIEFFHGTIEEAKELAKKENKLIFVDCYTTWCGPCKMLSKFVFTDPEMASFYNENFINLKLDMEAEGRMFAIEYGISAYPTLLFLDHVGTVRKKIVGGRDPKTFVQEGKSVMMPDENYIRKLSERFENGERETEFLKSYTRALSKAEKPYEIPLRELLFNLNETQQKQQDNTDFLFDITNQIQSKGAEILLKEKDLYISRYSAAKYDSKLLTIATNSAKNAAKNRDEAAFKNSIKFLSNVSSSEKNKSQEHLYLNWNENMSNWNEYCKRAGKYYERYLKNDSTEFLRILQKIDRTAMEANALKSIEKPAKSFSKSFPSFTNQLLYTRLLAKMGKMQEAESNIPSLTKIANQDQLQEIEELKMRIQQLRSNGNKPIPVKGH